MADIDLPVFSFTPNWANGVTETLEWLTDVLRSMLGYEQRRSLRLTPRRFFEATFNPTDNERSFLALWLQRFAEEEFLMPIWHDKAKLSSTALTGASRLDFDNTYREFVTGGLALIRQDAFNYEVVEINAQDDDGLDLVDPIGADWGEGTVVYPLRPAQIDNPELRIAAITRRVGDMQLAFKVTRSNPYEAGAEGLTLYDGYPVMSIEPNRRDALATQFERLFEESDAKVGLTYRRDEAGRAFGAQFYDWQARGRQQHHELRQALYRLNGRQKAVWMPTFNQDVVLARTLAVGAVDMDIEQIGYGYLGGPVNGREHILLRDDDNVTQIVKITDTDPPLATDEERLSLSAATTFSAQAGRTGSFVELLRLEQDSIEIVHHTDSDGMCEAAAAFKAFRSGRTTDGALIDPIPTAEMNDFPCGVVAEVLTTVNLNARVHGGSTAAAGHANGILVSGLDPSDTLELTMPPGGAYIAYSVWGKPNFTSSSSSGSTHRFYVLLDDDIGNEVMIGNTNRYDGYEAARAAFETAQLTGYSSYRFFIKDSPLSDNSGGLSIHIDRYFA